MQKNQWKDPNFQIQCFYITMGRQELCAENAKKLEKLKHKLLKLLKRYDLDITIVIGFQSPLTP